MADAIKEKLIVARDKIADVYNTEATDDKPDNGNLTNLNDILLKINIEIAKHT